MVVDEVCGDSGKMNLNRLVRMGIRINSVAMSLVVHGLMSDAYLMS